MSDELWETMTESRRGELCSSFTDVAARPASARRSARPAF